MAHASLLTSGQVAHVFHLHRTTWSKGITLAGELQRECRGCCHPISPAVAHEGTVPSSATETCGNPFPCTPTACPMLPLQKVPDATASSGPCTGETVSDGGWVQGLQYPSILRFSAFSTITAFFSQTLWQRKEQFTHFELT